MELLFFEIAPTNISVLSQENIGIKIWHLMMVLSAVPNIEIACIDAAECVDDNKRYMMSRKEQEDNERVRNIIEKDIAFLEHIQTEMATARQFMMIARCRGMKPEQVFQEANRVAKIIRDQGFEARRMRKADIKRFLALYFNASINGELMPDLDGAPFLEVWEDGGTDMKGEDSREKEE